MGRIIGFSAAAALAFVAWGGTAEAAAPAAAGPQPLYREIKDWLIGCDNSRACNARFVMDESSADTGLSSPGYLQIARSAGPDGKLAVYLHADEKAPDPAALRLDGKPLGAFPWRRDTDNPNLSLKGEDALRFVRAIREGGRLTYSDAADAPFVSLRGLSAVLLAMDEVQGRLGNETALIRLGPAPASAVPAPAPLPVVHAAPAKAPLADADAFAAAVRKSRQALLKKHECAPETAGADAAYALNGSEAIVLLGCMEAAYQSSVLVLRAPRSAPTQARQVIFPPQPTVDPKLYANQGGEYIALGGWDEGNAALTETAKGRGIADCGSRSTWVFDGQDFHLSEFASQPRCGGVPGDWPILFRAKVVLDR